MPALLLLRSLPPLKRCSLALPSLRSLSTHPDANADADASASASAPTKAPIRRVIFRGLYHEADSAPRPLVRKIAFVPPGAETPLIRRYESFPHPTVASTGRPLPESEADSGPLIRKTGNNWSGTAPTIRREFDYFAPPEPPTNPPAAGRLVIERSPDMTAPGHAAAAAEAVRPRITAPKKELTVGQHVVDRPEIETTWVDTHCHLFTTLTMLRQLSGDTTIPENGINDLVKTLFPPQVTAVVDIHCDLPTSNLHEYAVSLPWPAHFKYYFSMGAHPHCAADYTDEAHAAIVAAMSHPACVAWGECGLDYFKNHVATHALQRAVFARQLTAAVDARKPIIVHTRSADDDTLAALRAHVPADHRMHVHCFTAGPKLARALMAEWANAYIGITGVVSYRDMEHVTALLESGDIPAERMLLETDSPYMVPRSVYRWLADQKPELAKRRFHVSHAGMIPFTAETVLLHVNAGRAARGEAEMGLVELLDVTRANAARMYGIDV